MNDPLEYVQRLADCARQEEPAQGHVLPKALARLREVGTPPLVIPWSLFAAGALSLAAIASLSIVANYDRVAPDPILVLFKMASINLQGNLL